MRKVNRPRATQPSSSLYKAIVIILNTPVPRAPASSTPDDLDAKAARIQSLAIAAVNNPAIAVTVTPRSDMGFLILLIGYRADKDRAADLMGRITEALKKAANAEFTYLDKTFGSPTVVGLPKDLRTI